MSNEAPVIPIPGLPWNTMGYGEAPMSRLTLSLDRDLLDEAQRALGAATKSETIRIALREVLRKKQLAAVLEHQGAIELDLDQESLQQLRRAG
jgi:Arc/MetJ family transcription regulator